MFNKVYDIDFKKLVFLKLPTDLRNTLMINWLQSVIIPISIIYSAFVNNRESNIYKLAHNCQVCYLTKVLNDAFDSTLRRIYITNGNLYARQFIYTNVEHQPKYLGTMYLRQNDDYADAGIDFRVVLPIGFDLAGNVHQLRALIDYYKLASKAYKIQFENE